MTSLRDAIDKGKRLGVLRPWPRIAVDQSTWVRIAREISKQHGDMLGLWSDGAEVHMAVLAKGEATPVVVAMPVERGGFHAIGHLHPPAQRLERTIRDIYGLEPRGLGDDRPWLDHGVWGLAHPGADGVPREAAPTPYAFLPVEGEPHHKIPVGPVHAGIIEPGHFRFSANGETVVRLEERLGYTHKGVETLMRGAPLQDAVRLAGRVSGDSTVAYALAFSHAVEAAAGAIVPPRAIYLRALMAELERIANHIGDVGAVCNDAAFAIMQAHCAILREHVLRACKAAFGHRLMMDRIVPGGVLVDLTDAGAREIEAALRTIDDAMQRLLHVYDSTASLQDRTVATGRLDAGLARQFACGGFVGRASGRAFDARRDLTYAPYDSLRFDVIVRDEGDVDARVRVRLDEIAQSMSLVRQMLANMPRGDVFAQLPEASSGAEGIAVVESFRGDVLVWLRLDGAGRMAACHLRDPSWFQWPVLEAAIEGNIVADFPLCNKSFNCSYSGHDL